MIDSRAMKAAAGRRAKMKSLDQERMRDLYLFTARTMQTDHPVPYGALIVKSKTGERLVRATNNVARKRSQLSR
jgi:tRNA(Arg) A34 adenosine deaminase TadA